MSEVVCLCSWHGVGGAQLNAALVATELSKRGAESSLAFLFARDEAPQFSGIQEKVIFDHVPRSPVAWIKFLLAVYSYLRKEDPKYIVGYHPFANIIGCLYSILSFKTKFIGTQRNPHSSQSYITTVIEKLLGSYFYEANICVSNAIYQDYSFYPKRYVDKMVVVHNGTPKLPPPEYARVEIRERYNMSGFVLGSLGRLHEQKNIEFTIRLMARMPMFTYYIAGDGEQKSYLLELVRELRITDRVFFIGELSGNEVSEFYTAIDLLLFPSLYEGFGRVLVEALSYGLPIVCNDITVLREVGKDAVSFASLEPDEWIAEIEKFHALVESNGFQESKAKSVAAEFSISNMIDGYSRYMKGVSFED